LKSVREDDLKKLRENALQGSLDEEIQRRLWNEDVTFCSKEKISEWLGTK
jgi:phosphosulfolactate phosphohydrolase-like enzyme